MEKCSIQESRSSELRTWYSRPLGRLLADAEQNAISEQLPGLFGYHLMIIDPPWESNNLSGSPISHRFIQSRDRDPAGIAAGLVAHPAEWPVMSDSLDAIIFPHTLELAGDPHQVLREADRCLIPEGHLVILGFNPLGLWGFRKILTPDRRGAPWNTRFFSLSRLRDWLSLLGFDIVHSRYLFHRPPVNKRGILNRLGVLNALDKTNWPLLAGAYLLVARKRELTMTPIRYRWKPQRIFAPGVAGSTQRTSRRAR